MVIDETDRKVIVRRLIEEKLKPSVRKVDEEAYYAKDYLISLGKAGLFQSNGIPEHHVLKGEVQVVEETAKVCMTTAFNLWCHLASLTYIRKCQNSYLKKAILPSLENGTFLGATGLSNPMKYYAGLESLHLKATRTDGGYVIHGNLPAVSNLDGDHWFGVVAATDDDQRIMAFVPCNAEGLTLKEKQEYLGVNGSATYACKFNQVFISDDWIISDNADDFVKVIRPIFVLYQIPLGLGVTDASIESIQKVRNKQEGCNRFLSLQPDEVEEELAAVREKTYQKAVVNDITTKWEDLLSIRLDTVNLTIKAVHTNMLHLGGTAYLQKSDSSRRLREAYFFVNLTPTVKHLEKLLAGQTGEC